MQHKFFLNACIKLHPQEGSTLNFDEVGAEVRPDFIEGLKKFHSRVVTFCIKELKTVKLEVISIKLMPIGDKIKIIANVILSEQQAKAEAKVTADAEAQTILKSTGSHLVDNSEGLLGEEKPDPYRKIEFFPDEDLPLIQGLIAEMEKKSKKKLRGKFVSLVHIRIIPGDENDLSVDKF